ncbi:hypothetical protein ACFE04_007252 [Oxalis oulophora]
MANRSVITLLIFSLVLSNGLLSMAMGLHSHREETEKEEEVREGVDWFLLQKSKQIMKTDAGDMRVVKGYGGVGGVSDRPMHIGFIRMEPKSLFVPQYVDTSLILFVRQGEAKVGNIYRDDLVERSLKMGDIYRIPAGSVFYLINTAEGQRLHVICSIDTTESIGIGLFQSFFIGGGKYPSSVLSGFEPETLRTAFNVSGAELKEIMTRQEEGPIIYTTDTHPQSMWTNFLEQKSEDKLQNLRRIFEFQQEPYAAEKEKTWSWRKLLNSVLGEEDNSITHKAPDSYNIYKRKADFKNNYGWSVALDEHDYKPLKHSGIGFYLVNLTAGSMMAPHINPTATEYGIVLRGTGTIQIVFPNGTTAMNTEVRAGDVFWVPRYFPFCQIASREGPFEFFGFTTSARRNRPQFLVGGNSVLHTLRSPELAAAFGVSEKRLRSILDAQKESVILPSVTVAPPGEDVGDMAMKF